MTDAEKIEILKQKTQEKLLKACERLYNAELGLCELSIPQEWKDEYKAAHAEWVEVYQDYNEVRTYQSLSDM